MGLDDDLALATALSRAAGEAILDVKAEAMAHPEQKSDESPVTLADLAADRIIRAGLGEHNGLVITEETWRSGVIGRHPRVWVVDPLDGTEDFIAGRDDFCVQIGLVVDGVPALGVVYAPESGVTWRGVVAQQRCERMDAHGIVSTRTVARRPLSAQPRVALSVAHRSALVEDVVREMGCVPVWRGSVGLKIGMIVDDEADAYVTASRHIKVWDTGAPTAVLLAAGGLVTSLDQTPLRFDDVAPHQAGLCAWTPAACTALQEKLRAALATHRATTPSP